MRTLQSHPFRISRGSCMLLAMLCCVACTPADAHLVTTGLGPVYDGIVHLMLSPADLAVVLVLTSLAAMRGAQSGRWLLVLLPVSWLLGGITGLLFPITVQGGWATGLSFLVAGVLVAIDWKLPLLGIAALVVPIGMLHGYLTGAAFAKGPAAGLELTGTLVALIMLVTLIAGLVVSIKSFWARVVVRVLGSWIAATGLLVIGWSLRGGG